MGPGHFEHRFTPGAANWRHPAAYAPFVRRPVNLDVPAAASLVYETGKPVEPGHAVDRALSRFPKVIMDDDRPAHRPRLVPSAFLPARDQ